MDVNLKIYESVGPKIYFAVAMCLEDQPLNSSYTANSIRVVIPRS